jgi:hypothetical protein
MDWGKHRLVQWEGLARTLQKIISNSEDEDGRKLTDIESRTASGRCTMSRTRINIVAFKCIISHGGIGRRWKPADS